MKAVVDGYYDFGGIEAGPYLRTMAWEYRGSAFGCNRIQNEYTSVRK